MSPATGTPTATAPPSKTLLDGREVRLIEVRALAACETNGRAHADPRGLAELTESVRAHGVLQPLIVRNVPGGGPMSYEVVCGHRRLEAARQAGLDWIPAAVMRLDDAEASQVQLVENLQREDLSPMDEALALERLLATLPLEEAAARLGKSRGYVQGRMLLTRLPKKARLALEAGTLSLSVALMVARVPDEALREQVAEEVQEGRSVWGGECFVHVPLTVSEAHRAFEKTLLRLKHATFDTHNGGLLEDMPACTVCVHRTGNAADLFGDVGDQDTCTNPPCFQRKRDAGWALRRAEAEAKGYKALPDARARRILFDDGGVRSESGFIAPGAPVGRDGDSRTWLQVAKAAKVKPLTLVVRNPRTDRPVQLWRSDDLLELLPKAEKARKALPAPKPGASEAPAREEPPRPGPSDWDVEQEARPQIEGEIASLAGELPPSAFLHALVNALLEGYELPVYLRLLELPVKTRLKDLKDRQCQQVIALHLARDRECIGFAGPLGVKVRPLLAAARARLMAKESAQDTPKSTPGGVGETCEPCDCDDEEACEAGKRARARKAKPAGRPARKKRARR